jgi:uncharacterized protein YneF (UPF0154 family)
MMSYSPNTPPNILSDESQQQLQLARATYRKIRRAISVAQGDGWTIGFFAAISFLWGLVTLDWFNMFVGAVLMTIAWVELRGAAQFRRLDVDAPKLLVRNQLVLGGILVFYALWKMYAAYHGQSALQSDAGDDPQLKEMLAPYEGLDAGLNMLVYGVVLLIGVGNAAGMSYYYFTRQKYIDAYLKDTPQWIISMQKAGMTF